MSIPRQIKCFILVLCVFIANLAYAQSGYLTMQDIQRVREIKQMLTGIDTKSLEQSIDDLERTRHPQITLQIKEAMAKTYAELVSEYNVSSLKKKEWLYSMVNLNMAYLQFGGDQRGAGNSLNKLICLKLMEYLPQNALKQPGLVYSLD